MRALFLAGEKGCIAIDFNSLPDMPILGSSHSTANKDVMSKIWTNGHKVI